MIPTWTAIAGALVLAASGSVVAGQPVVHDMTTIETPTATFRIDRHEVSVGQFRAFARATGSATRAERDGGGSQYLGGWVQMKGWTWERPFGRPASDDEPAVHVTFSEAASYCAWAGLRLPTDAEWVAAAYTEHRADPPSPFEKGSTYPYPTGNTAEGANHLDFVGRWPRPAREKPQRGQGHIAVRQSAQGVNGLWDMGANAWEWVDHGRDQKRTRGGSWWYGAAQMRADALYEKPPEFAAVYIGFRCAADQR